VPFSVVELTPKILAPPGEVRRYTLYESAPLTPFQLTRILPAVAVGVAVTPVGAAGGKGRSSGTVRVAKAAEPLTPTDTSVLTAVSVLLNFTVKQ